MKTQIWVYIAVAVLSIGAGVAIAGTPNTVRRDPTIQVPATTVPVPVTLPVVTEPDVTVAPEPPLSTDAPATTLPTTTTVAPESTTTTTAAITIVPRGEVTVAVANGAAKAGIARSIADGLQGMGYVDVQTADGREIVDISVIYVGPFRQLEGERLAADLGIDPTLVFPIDSAPPMDGYENEQIVAYIGRDLVP